MNATALTLINNNHADAGLIERTINDAVKDGARVTVNGREVRKLSWTARPASTWQNGSVSINVAPRNKGTRSQTGTVWVKTGQSVTVEVVAGS